VTLDEVRGEDRPSPIRKWVLLTLCLLATALFVALGIWQIERRAWKLALIDEVNARVHAPPVAAPPPTQWSGITAQNAAYRHVTAAGRYLNDRETLVQALTEQGTGFWVLTPFETADGSIILVNRGFVPSERASSQTRLKGLIEGPASVTGLLRLSEPKGGFLRTNEPDKDRWFSRDLEGIARNRHLAKVAPYFIDADATPNTGGWPVGGLTVISFPNNHLVYVLTWFSMAALSIVGAVVILRDRETP
jgi:surfeit locus 1 family protein